MSALRLLIRPTITASRGVARLALFHTTRVARDGRVLKIKKEEFEEIVLKAKQPVIVDFYADWCGPCKVLGPILAKSIAENKKVTMAKLDVDEALDVAFKYEIRALPTVAAFYEGKVVDRFVGARDPKFVKYFVEKHGKLAK